MEWNGNKESRKRVMEWKENIGSRERLKGVKDKRARR